MSYMRSPYMLDWFYGISEYYVYGGLDGIDDCGAGDYADNPSFIELIGTFIERECGDKDYADKIVRVLAHKLGCADKLRPKRLTYDEWNTENKVMSECLHFGDIARVSLEEVEFGIKCGFNDEQIIEGIRIERESAEIWKKFREGSFCGPTQS